MQTEQKDILNTQLNAESNPKSESGSDQLFKVKRIQGTPFHKLERNGEYFLTLGNHLLTVGMEKEEDIHKYMIENQWNLATTLILLLIDQDHSEIYKQERRDEATRETNLNISTNK